ncbi:MAG: hypothetical protein AAB564_02115 [Patescibacteria group bacterium]
MKIAKKSDKNVSPTVLNKYLKADLFKELGMEILNSEEKASYIEAIGDVVNRRLIIRLMKEMDDGQKERLDKVLTEHPNNNLMLGQFLKLEMPNLQSIINEETAAYKKELIDTFNA